MENWLFPNSDTSRADHGRKGAGPLGERQGGENEPNRGEAREESPKDLHLPPLPPPLSTHPLQ